MKKPPKVAAKDGFYCKQWRITVSVVDCTTGGGTRAREDQRARAYEWGEKFITFHNENPAVYKALVHAIREWIDIKGFCQVGVGLVWERARWSLNLEIKSDKYEFRLNDAYRSYYTRLILHREPQFARLIEIRRSIADEFMAANAYRCN